MRSFNAESVVEIDGEKLTLVCDFSTIDVVEGITGQNWDDILPQLANPPAALSIKLLWGLLRKKHDGITLDEAAGLYHHKKSAEIGVVMGDVIARACNLGEEEKDANPPKRRGRSKSSVKNG